MNEFKQACPEYKEKYQQCFNEWYKEQFLTGRMASNACKEEWEDFRVCMQAFMKVKAETDAGSGAAQGKAPNSGAGAR
eukprot:tig00021721_g23208.t1